MPEEQEKQNESTSEAEIIPAGSASKDDRNLALLAHLVLIFSIFIGPLIFWLIKKDEGGFIEEQTKEALNFGITLALIYFVLTLSVVGVILIWLVCLVQLIFPIVAAVKVSNGENYRYPFSLRLIK